MPSERPFLRKAVLTVWPTAASEARKIEADGTTSKLRLAFSIAKSVLGVPNNSYFTCYNLSKDTRELLQTTPIRLLLEVGWDNYGMFELFQGDLVSAVSQRQGADIVTRLAALTGLTATQSCIASQTFSQGTKLTDALKMLVAKLSGVTYDDKRVKIIDGKIGFGGISYAGSTTGFLDKLAFQFGFSWSIQDGVFQALQDSGSFGKVLTLSSDKKTLYSITPMLSGPLQVQYGVTISCFLTPNVLPGDTVDVSSEISPHLNGLYKIHTLNYNGDTGGAEWDMTIQSFKDNPQAKDIYGK